MHKKNAGKVDRWKHLLAYSKSYLDYRYLCLNLPGNQETWRGGRGEERSRVGDGTAKEKQ